MTISENKIGVFSKVLLAIAGILLIASIFTPIWRIELDAPQYPEGLALTIHANKLAGDVDIINGLNHYIGMNTLHTEDFIEFTLLPYIISAYALACFMVIFIAKRKALNILLITFILFGIIAMVDFWRWEYNYGHNLNPNAAIIVPGMAYQPPLIGFKQLLNFGAYSIPDTGGWLFITSGVLMVVAYLKEFMLKRKLNKEKISSAMKQQVVASLVVLAFILSSCNTSKPEPIKLNTDNCDNCGMTITDPKFATELLTSKGRYYKFDDVSCLLNYITDNKDKADKAKCFVADYLGNNQLIPVETSVFIAGENINSPMGGNTAAFSNKDSAAKYASKYEAETLTWEKVSK